MKRGAVSILSILALGVSDGPALCELPPVVTTGAIVRVNAPKQDRSSIVGKVLSVDDKTLVLRIDALSQLDNATTAEIPVAGIQGIEVRRPTSRNTMGKGALVGGVAGVALDLVQLGVVWGRGRSCGDDCGIPLNVLVVPVVAGALVGGFIGSMVKVHRWEPASLPVSPDRQPRISLGIAPTTHRGLRGGLTVTF